MTPPRSYPSDLTDEQWALIQPLLPPPVNAGAPRTTNLRAVLNAIFYLTTNGCAWYALPHDFPPEGTVRSYFHRWRRNGTWQAIHDALRTQVRLQAGKEPEPSAGSIDSQSVKAARTAHTRGYDAGKKNQRGETASVGGHVGAGVGGTGAFGGGAGSDRGATGAGGGGDTVVATDGEGVGGRRLRLEPADEVGLDAAGVDLGGGSSLRQRLPGAAQAMGGGADVRLVEPLPSTEPALRVLGPDRGGHDTRRNDPSHAPTPATQGPQTRKIHKRINCRAPS